VDIYMPDFKYSSSGEGLKYSRVLDYPQRAEEAIVEMHSQVGDLIIDSRGIAPRGLIVRHLVLPDGISGTKGVVDFIAGRISKNTYVNIMDQYHPCFKAAGYPSIDRPITRQEYLEALSYAKTAGLKRIDKEDLRGLFI
jgi:putative pyruvate formate lyase activating enzyme